MLHDFVTLGVEEQFLSDSIKKCLNQLRHIINKGWL